MHMYMWTCGSAVICKRMQCAVKSVVFNIDNRTALGRTAVRHQVGKFLARLYGFTLDPVLQ
jgi:hypothetical protein